VSELQPFLAMEVMERAFAMERAGIRVAHLEIGEPDFPVPQQVVDACINALAAGETRYTDSRGLPELREAIARDTERRFGTAVDPARVLVTSGTSPAMLMVFSLLVEEGDEVLVPSPHYPCYPNFIRYCGGTPVFVPTDAADGYRLDVDALKRACTPRTRAIIVGSPSNPTGAVQSRETLEAVAELGLPLISDEIYDGLVYDGAEVTSALEIGEDVFVLDGFSKRYAMTGFRLGYVIAPEWAMRTLQIMQQNLFISANRFVQHAGVAALEQGAQTLDAMREALDRRRHRLVDGLRELGLVIPQLPAGAFYVLADTHPLGPLGGDSRRLASELLERAHVGATPGVDFGQAGEGKLRFCYAVSDDTLDWALGRLAEVLPQVAQ
jgi:aspartate/methionine/tyrosine aminotransferase